MPLNIALEFMAKSLCSYICLLDAIMEIPFQRCLKILEVNFYLHFEFLGALGASYTTNL